MGNRYPEAVKHLEADFGVTEGMSNLIYPKRQKIIENGRKWQVLQYQLTQFE